ncbi:hypothetical protein [Sphingomonas sp. ID0503]|uniref:hypothetical protein n=1 Tax=Sphingomonas sp. ID0503 TaxID=3399691 RepID=UPI003AFAD822
MRHEIIQVEAAQPIAPAWWERRGVLATLVLLTIVPLLWPAIPPLTDLPAHMGRWHISMVAGQGGPLDRYYGFRWALVGNLGLDILAPALAHLIGIEAATKALVMLIPPLTAAGLLWTAREVHGRVPPTALFALPLVYAWPFQYGFVNFTLAQGLAFIGFGAWLRLGRQGRIRLRTALAVPFACALWVCHMFGWGMFGLMVLGAELAARRRAGLAWPAALLRAGTACLPLAVPLLFMAVAPKAGGVPLQMMNPLSKLNWMLSILRDSSAGIDLASVLLLFGALYIARRDQRLGFDSMVSWPAWLALAVFLVLPWRLLGGAYVDMRMAPAIVALALIAIRPPAEWRMARVIGALALGFFLFRIALGTASFAAHDGEWRRELAGVDAIPRGSAVLVLTAEKCNAWADDRIEHLGGMAIVRRDAFVNGQWALAGQQLLTIRHNAAEPFAGDMSQVIYVGTCAKRMQEKEHRPDFDQAIAQFPRSAFDYVWTVGFPAGAAHAPDLSLVWKNAGSALYRVGH